MEDGLNKTWNSFNCLYFIAVLCIKMQQCHLSLCLSLQQPKKLGKSDRVLNTCLYMIVYLFIKNIENTSSTLFIFTFNFVDNIFYNDTDN